MIIFDYAMTLYVSPATSYID